MPTYSIVNHALQFGSNAPTVSIYGTDVSGYITYQMSGSFYQFEPNTKYLALQVIFATPYGSVPTSLTLTPANSSTEQALTAQPSIGFFVDGGTQPGAGNSDLTTSYFNISGISASTAILGPQTLTWYYEVSTGTSGGVVVAGVSSISNSSGSLTISPTTGNAIASLNLAHSNTFTAGQTFSNHITVDGYTINLSGGASTNQALQYNGTSFIAGNVGTVTNVMTTSRLRGGPITATGTLDLNTSGVSAGDYTNANISVDAYGRITVATSGASGGITGLTAGRTPAALNSTTLHDAPWSRSYSFNTGPQNGIHNIDGGSTNGNGAINIQPSSGSGCFGASISFDNQGIDGYSGGSILWNLMQLSSSTSYQKWFWIAQSLNPVIMFSPTSNVFINEYGGDLGDARFVVGGDLKFTKGGQILYTVANSSNWNGSPPTHLQDAVDRIAAWIAAQGGTKP